MKYLKSFIITALVTSALVQGRRLLTIPQSNGAEVGLGSIVIPGDSVPDLVLYTHGQSKPVVLSGVLTSQCALVYFVDPDCPACSIGAEHWRDRSAFLGNDDPVPVTLVGLGGSTDSMQVFVERFGIRMPWYRSEPSTLQSVGLSGVPAAWWVKRGVVVASAEGALRTSPDSLHHRADSCGG